MEPEGCRPRDVWDVNGGGDTPPPHTPPPPVEQVIDWGGLRGGTGWRWALEGVELARAQFGVGTHLSSPPPSLPGRTTSEGVGPPKGSNDGIT